MPIPTHKESAKEKLAVYRNVQYFEKYFNSHSHLNKYFTGGLSLLLWCYAHTFSKRRYLLLGFFFFFHLE